MPRIDAFLTKNSYREKLQTPAWKNFSRQIKKERGDYCEMCKRSGVTLHVHHLFYESGKEPWQSDRADVVVLCAGCHSQTHEQLKAFRQFVFGKMNPQAFQILNGALAVAFDKYDPIVFAHALAEFVASPSLVQRFANAWGMSATPKDRRGYKSGCDVALARAELERIKEMNLKRQGKA